MKIQLVLEERILAMPLAVVFIIEDNTLRITSIVILSTKQFSLKHI